MSERRDHAIAFCVMILFGAVAALLGGWLVIVPGVAWAWLKAIFGPKSDGDWRLPLRIATSSALYAWGLYETAPVLPVWGRVLASLAIPIVLEVSIRENAGQQQIASAGRASSGVSFPFRWLLAILALTADAFNAHGWVAPAHDRILQLLWLVPVHLAWTAWGILFSLAVIALGVCLRTDLVWRTRAMNYLGACFVTRATESTTRWRQFILAQHHWHAGTGWRQNFLRVMRFWSRFRMVLEAGLGPLREPFARGATDKRRLSLYLEGKLVEANRHSADLLWRWRAQSLVEFPNKGVGAELSALVDETATLVQLGDLHLCPHCNHSDVTRRQARRIALKAIALLGNHALVGGERERSQGLVENEPQLRKQLNGYLAVLQPNEWAAYHLAMACTQSESDIETLHRHAIRFLGETQSAPKLKKPRALLIRLLALRYVSNKWFEEAIDLQSLGHTLDRTALAFVGEAYVHHARIIDPAFERSTSSWLLDRACGFFVLAQADIMLDALSQIRGSSPITTRHPQGSEADAGAT